MPERKKKQAPPPLTAEQQRIQDVLNELLIPVLGPTAPETGANGIVVIAKAHGPRLKPLRERGYRLTPSGFRHTIITEG